MRPSTMDSSTKVSCPVFFVFSFESYVAGTSFVLAPFQHWAERSWATACSQGSGVPSVSHDTWTADYSSADFLKGWMWLFTNLDVFPFLGLESPQGWAGTCVSQQQEQSSWYAGFHALLAALVVRSLCPSFVIWQLLSLDFDFSCLEETSAAQACGELHVSLGLFCCI